jgi:hypothetical protein
MDVTCKSMTYAPVTNKEGKWQVRLDYSDGTSVVLFTYHSPEPYARYVGMTKERASKELLGEKG